MAPVFGHGRLRLYLLKLLDESPRHGYELIRLLEDRFMGLYAPSAGTIYPRLQRLEAEGLVAHDEAGGRKVYRLTDTGRDELRRRGGELEQLETDIRESVHGLAQEIGEEVRDTARDLRDELRRAARDVRRSGRDRRSGQRWESFLSLLIDRQAETQQPPPPHPAVPTGGRPVAGPAAAPGQPAAREQAALSPEDFERRLQSFRDQARDLVHEAARDRRLTPEQLRDCVAVLADALARLRAALGR
jgi:DNA-binding PadR family transcriptional regulator